MRVISCRKYSECCLWTSRFSDTLQAERQTGRHHGGTPLPGHSLSSRHASDVWWCCPMLGGDFYTFVEPCCLYLQVSYDLCRQCTPGNLPMDKNPLLYVVGANKQILMWINPILLLKPPIKFFSPDPLHHVSLCSLDSSYLRDIIYSVKHGLHVCSLPQPAGHQPPQQLGQSFNERRILNFFTRTFPPLPRSSPPRPSAGRSAGNISQAECEFSNFTLYTWLQLYI